MSKPYGNTLSQLVEGITSTDEAEGLNSPFEDLKVNSPVTYVTFNHKPGSWDWAYLFENAQGELGYLSLDLGGWNWNEKNEFEDEYIGNDKTYEKGKCWSAEEVNKAIAARLKGRNR